MEKETTYTIQEYLIFYIIIIHKSLISGIFVLKKCNVIYAISEQYFSSLPEINTGINTRHHLQICQQEEFSNTNSEAIFKTN